MCNFCMLFDFSTYKAVTDQGVASLVKAPENIPFLPKDRFRFCPMCGSPIDPKSLELTNKFGRNLRTYRRMRGMTQTELGNRLGVQKSCISKYEKGRVKPDIGRLIQICSLLEISPQEIL